MARTTFSVNRVSLIGRVGQEPEYRPTGGGVLRLSIATDRYNGQGKDNTTDWHRVVVFGDNAEKLAQQISKGDKLGVEGNIKYGTYEKDGVTRQTTDIIADTIIPFSWNKGAGGTTKQPAEDLDWDA